ncbi:MAG: hypothetical protein ACLFU8_02650 [Anaerolineales bacterium]
MNWRKVFCWLSLLALPVLLFVVFEQTTRASPLPAIPPETDPPPMVATAPRRPGTEIAAQAAPASPRLSLAAAGDVIEVFTNTWSYSTIGLVYDPSRDHVRYAHESQSSSHNPTLYDVAYPPPHTLLFSMTLSTLNSGWPWQIDNRTGAGYDAETDTYFLCDYNGDLSNADDNIVEITFDGTIVNAWEMDDEVGSNDSADGSEIDSIIDIAVVPGEGSNPTRYFATAAYDDAVVYEIALTKTGTLWTPNSWTTVMTYTGAISDTFRDNLGIDYDAQNGFLYHSGWHTTTILVTDLDMNPVTIFSSTFDCPGAGGYNSGVTFIEGSQPPEVWVTDFSSDQTTRCEAPSEAPPPPSWEKFVNDLPWTPGMTSTVETSDTLKVVDILVGVQPLSLLEEWDPGRLELLDWELDPPVGEILTTPHSLRWNIPPFPEVVTMTKFFHVRPSTWTTTLLRESLWTEGTLPEERTVPIEKLPPVLVLYTDFQPDVFPGQVATYTLLYENLGGYENDVEIRSALPPTVTFLHANPYPDQVAPGSVTWQLGDLPQGMGDRIDVFVRIGETAVPSETLIVENEIFDHLDVPRWRMTVDYHVVEPPPLVWNWEKFVNGEPWTPELVVSVETSQTIQVIDIVEPDASLLIESWDPAHLRLESARVSAGSIVTGMGFLEWSLPPTTPVPATITKTFHVRPCVWTGTEIWEELLVWDGVQLVPVDTRPVFIEKIPPQLWIESQYEPLVQPGEIATFTLRYGNNGGFESGGWISNTFPMEAVYVGSVSDPPLPVSVGPGGLWARWELEPLATGETGVITVNVEIAPNLPPPRVPPIYDYIYDHAGIERDWTEILFRIEPPAWGKWIDGVRWYPGISLTVETSDTFQVVDVITGAFNTTLLEFWNSERLELVGFTPSAGVVVPGPNGDLLEWHVPATAPEVVTLTKEFHVRGGAWTESPLHEELLVEGEFWQERPLLLRKAPPDLRLTAAYEPQEAFAGERVTYTLFYENVGGYVNDAWVTSTFPISAPIVHTVADPLVPQQIGPQGLWARWDVGALETHEGGAITVSVVLSEVLQPYEVIHTYNYIYDQVDTIGGQVHIEHDWQPISYTIQPVEPTWEKELWINGEGPFPVTDGPHHVATGDLVSIVDRVHVAAGTPVSYTLTEIWQEGLAFHGAVATAGIVVTTTDSLEWRGWEIAPNTWHVLTKTFEVTWSDWEPLLITETLRVAEADPVELPPIMVHFEPPRIYLPLVLRN